VKKVLAILLLVVFLFNVGGYYIFFWGLDYSAKTTLTQRLDSGNYSELETFEFKIPLNIPYPIQSQSRGFDRAHGAFEHNGEFYELVKQKFENDTLYVVCVKNEKKHHLAQAFKKYARISTDAEGSSQAGNDLVSKLVKDFNTPSLSESITADGWSRTLLYAGLAVAIIKMASEVVSPPPNSILS